MEYIIGILLGIIAILFFQSKKFVTSSEDKEQLDKTTKEIQSNKDQIKKEEEKLSEQTKRKSKTLSELADYFNKRKQ